MTALPATDLDHLFHDAARYAAQRPQTATIDAAAPFAPGVAPSARESDFTLYEKAIHSKTPPPGTPFGYILEVTTCTCGACGSISTSSRLFQVLRAGYGSKVYAVGGASPIFDRPIKRVNKHEATPVCLSCIEDLRPHPVHYPVPGAVVGLRKSDAEVARLTGAAPVSRRPSPVAVDDVADDFA